MCHALFLCCKNLDVIEGTARRKFIIELRVEVVKFVNIVIKLK